MEDEGIVNKPGRENNLLINIIHLPVIAKNYVSGELPRKTFRVSSRVPRRGRGYFS